MKEDVYRFAGAVLLTILVLLGIGAVLHILLTLPIDGKGPEWVGAIGTVATLIGTIWLATAENRRRRDVDLQTADLRAVAIMSGLAAVRLRLTGAQQMLDVDPVHLYLNPGIFDSVNRVIFEIPAWGVEDALPFAVYRGDIPKTLVQLFTDLRTVKHIAAINRDTPYADKEKADQARNLLPILAKAIDQIARAEVALKKHARVHDVSSW